MAENQYWVKRPQGQVEARPRTPSIPFPGRSDLDFVLTAAALDVRSFTHSRICTAGCLPLPASQQLTDTCKAPRVGQVNRTVVQQSVMMLVDRSTHVPPPLLW
ncbi:hypothetical protein HRR82_001183 [Exophiala dermatitidis]|nr:hypothetical protein HRR82_001183 [Exophiala dermatitidis]